MKTEPSPAAQKIGTVIAPAVQVGVDDLYQEVLDEGNLLERRGAKWLKPKVDKKVLPGSQLVSHHVLSHCGTMSIAEVVELLADHMLKTGQAHKMHPSFAAFRMT